MASDLCEGPSIDLPNLQSAAGLLQWKKEISSESSDVSTNDDSSSGDDSTASDISSADSSDEDSDSLSELYTNEEAHYPSN